MTNALKKDEFNETMLIRMSVGTRGTGNSNEKRERDQ